MVTTATSPSEKLISLRLLSIIDTHEYAVTPDDCKTGESGDILKTPPTGKKPETTTRRRRSWNQTSGMSLEVISVDHLLFPVAYMPRTFLLEPCPFVQDSNMRDPSKGLKSQKHQEIGTRWNHSTPFSRFC